MFGFSGSQDLIIEKIGCLFFDLSIAPEEKPMKQPVCKRLIHHDESFIFNDAYAAVKGM